MYVYVCDLEVSYFYWSKGWEIFEWLFPDAKKRKNTDHFGRVLIPLLKRKYPQGKDSLSFDELLDWNLWHCYIRVFGKE